MAQIEPFDLATFAREIGWSVAGVSEAKISNSTQNQFDLWLQSLKGPGLNYLERRKRERKEPKSFFSKAETILCFGLYYFKGWAKGEAKISNYAWGEDYHETLKRLLEQTALRLQENLGPFEFKSSVDTAPLLEKPLAVQAGLGWQGKNTLLLNSKFGSYLFLGELITTIPIQKFQVQLPIRDHCGTCTRCIDACPTEALTPYRLDASKCISYWTLEHKGSFTPSTPPFHGWVAGCDICQEVCPWNQKLIPLPLTQDEKEFQSIEPDEILNPQWPERIRSKALNYMPLENWKRNLDHLKSKSI